MISLADRPLVLVQQRNSVDQRQVLLLIPPQPHARRGERELLGERVHHSKRPQKRLCCTMRGDNGLAARSRQQPLQRPRRPLPRLDRSGLFARLVDRQHQTAIQQLLIDVDRGRRQEQHHRPFHAVFLRDQLTCQRILASAGDRQLALRLQQLQRIRRLPYTLLLGDRQHLVLHAGFAKVKQALSRHRRVLHPLGLGHQRQHCVHQRALARRARALDQDRQWLVQLARHARQIRHQRIAGLANNACGFDIGDDALDQIRRFQQRQRGFQLLRRQCRRCLFESLRFQLRADQLVLALFNHAQQFAQIAAQHVLRQPEFDRRLLQPPAALLRRVQLHRVDVERITALGFQPHPELLVTGVLLDPAHRVRAITECQAQLTAFGDLDRDFWCCRRHAIGGQLWHCDGFRRRDFLFSRCKLSS